MNLQRREARVVDTKNRHLSSLKALSAYRLIDPGSEWRLHRHWSDATALSDLLGPDFQLGCKENLSPNGRTPTSAQLPIPFAYLVCFAVWTAVSGFTC